jgi:hypothetical protein
MIERLEATELIAESSSPNFATHHHGTSNPEPVDHDHLLAGAGHEDRRGRIRGEGSGLRRSPVTLPAGPARFDSER